MKKLFLAVSICASLVASNAVWAAEIVEKSESAVPSQSKIVEAAAMNWVKDVAHDMQLSADPLGRAMAEVALQVLAAAANNDAKASMGTLTQEQKQALYSSKTAMPMRILLLQSACAGFYNQDALCSDPKLADAFISDDGKNAFTVLIAESLRATVAMEALQSAKAVNGKKPDYRELAKAQQTLSSARVLQALSVTSEYYDYAQAYKAPILITVKRRPPPPEVLASLPIEVAGLAAAFAPEEIAAEVFANALITSTEASYRQISACALPDTTELKAQCARIANLILANPKNSAASAGFALQRNQEHPYVTRMTAFSGIATQKVMEPANLLTLDWLALRSVLHKAATQGDVAAIPDALAWAEQAYAKIPDKSAELLAIDAKEREEQKAMWEAELALKPNTDAAAAATTEIDLDFDAVPPPAKASGGCGADANETVDPTAVEFKN